MSDKARDRIARVESHRPPPPLTIVRASSGDDRSAELVAWIRNLRDRLARDGQDG